MIQDIGDIDPLDLRKPRASGDDPFMILLFIQASA